MTKSITETKVRYDRKDHYVYQDINGDVLWAPTDFIIGFDGDNKTKSKYRKALRRLFKYINTRGHPMTWLDMNDEHMEKFRAWSLGETQADARYRGEESLAKQTTNNDFLMPIYAFYYWVQKKGKYHQNILGHDPQNINAFQITSSLLQRDIAISKDEKPNNDWLYPKLFKGCDTRGRKDRSANENDLDELNGYIIANYNGYERTSLLLIVQIIHEAGARPISIASLIRYQFHNDTVDRELFKEKKGVFEVVPKKAKFGGTMPIRFPVSTTMSIMSFIKNDLESFLNTHKVKGYEGHLFLSPKSKKALSESDIVKIFSEITTELGWPKGKSIYSFRHKFSGDSLDKHLAVAIELGFSLNEASIALQMQRDMTHRSKGSLEDYVESRMRMGKKTEANKKDLRIKSLESDKTRLALEAQKAFEIADMKAAQNQDLMAEVEKLKSVLASLKSDEK
jgi:site-specific recombinase XerD